MCNCMEMVQDNTSKLRRVRNRKTDEGCTNFYFPPGMFVCPVVGGCKQGFEVRINSPAAQQRVIDIPSRAGNHPRQTVFPVSRQPRARGQLFTNRSFGRLVCLLLVIYHHASVWLAALLSNSRNVGGAIGASASLSKRWSRCQGNRMLRSSDTKYDIIGRSFNCSRPGQNSPLVGER